MEQWRFDLVGRRLARADSRRATLRALAAGALATGFGAITQDASRAKKKKGIGERCKKSSQCKGQLLCKNANSQNSCYAKTEKRCCVKEGGYCNPSCDCCGVDVICNGHVCQKA